MDARTRKALEGSIKKWEGIVAGKVRDEGSMNCPLCELFNNIDSDPMCAGCPVAEKIGQTGCDGTPYEEFCKHATRGGYAESPSARRIAKAELAFLISLRSGAA